MEAAGLGLLPVKAKLTQRKTTRVVQACTVGGHRFGPEHESFATLDDGGREGTWVDRVIDTYLHEAFERLELLATIGINVSNDRVMDFETLADWFDPFSGTFAQLFL